jgi:hypothetical protein
MTDKLFISTILLLTSCLISCNKKSDKQSEEQIVISFSVDESSSNDRLFNSVSGNVTMKQIATFPSKVILTGLDNHRLVSIYKSKATTNSTENSSGSSYSYDSDESGDESIEHFMPGIDIVFGYNLLNIAHYDLKLEKGNYLFSHPVLVKTLYYPSFTPDSLDNQPINRNYYLVSVYDEDTNKDSLINKKDLRRFYHFDASSSIKKLLIPIDYSVIRSEYDSKNDLMYIFARQDANKNGTQDKAEPVHVFWFSLKTPDIAKLLY